MQTFYVWDGGNMVLEYEATDPENLIADYKKFYAYGADGLAYRKDIDGSVYTYNTNYRGDVLSVMDDERNIKAEYMYDAYGNLVDSNVAAGFSDNFGYRGEYTDPESGYIYLRNRYFDPKTGRFLTEDPIRDGLNWFAYCDGNPVKFTDKWGLGFTMPDYGGAGDEILADMQELTDDELLYDTKSDCVVYIENSEKGDKPAGTALIRELIENPIVFEIVYTTDNNSYCKPRYDRNNNLIGGRIEYNPNLNFKVWVNNGSGNNYLAPEINYIVLGHEFCHLYNRIMNNYDNMPIKNGNIYNHDYYDKDYGFYRGGVYYYEANGVYHTLIEKVEELNATGILYYRIWEDENGNSFVYSVTPTSFSENILRAEHGLPLRVVY